MKLIAVVRDALRTKGYAYKTEKAYMNWIRRYIRFHLPSHPREVATDGVKKFLTHLAVDEHVIRKQSENEHNDSSRHCRREEAVNCVMFRPWLQWIVAEMSRRSVLFYSSEDRSITMGC